MPNLCKPFILLPVEATLTVIQYGENLHFRREYDWIERD